MKKIALVDIGSNTIRMVVYEQTARRVKEIATYKFPAQLGTFLSIEGVLSAEGVRELRKILFHMSELCSELDVTHKHFFATATLRSAKNQKEVLQSINATLGIEIEIVSEDDEAYYGYLAVKQTLPYAIALCADLGGGSCELTHYENGERRSWCSLPIGSLRLTELDADESVLYEDVVRQWTSEVPMNNVQVNEFIAIGGNARAIAKVHSQLKRANFRTLHGYTLSVDELYTLIQEMKTLGVKKLAKMEGISNTRAETLVACTKFFYVLCQKFGAKRFVVSREGVREGYLIGKLHVLDEQIGAQTSAVKLLAHDFQLSVEQKERVVPILRTFLDELIEDRHSVKQEVMRNLAIEAYLLSDLGSIIHSDSIYQHTFYCLIYQDMPSHTYEEQFRLAMMASYKNQRRFLAMITDSGLIMSESEIENLELYAVCVRWFIAMRFEQFRLLPKITVVRTGDSIDLCIHSNRTFFFEGESMEKFTKQLRRLMKKEIALEVFA